MGEFHYRVTEGNAEDIMDMYRGLTAYFGFHTPKLLDCLQQRRDGTEWNRLEDISGYNGPRDPSGRTPVRMESTMANGQQFFSVYVPGTLDNKVSDVAGDLEEVERPWENRDDVIERPDYLLPSQATLDHIEGMKEKFANRTLFAHQNQK